MNLTSDPLALRELIRYYRRVASVNAKANCANRDFRSKADLAVLAASDKEVCERLIALTGDANVSTPEAWR